MKRIKKKENYKRLDNADSKRFSQIRKKSVFICINLCYLCAYWLGRDERNKQQAFPCTLFPVPCTFYKTVINQIYK
jgi:hypothetical protein